MNDRNILLTFTAQKIKFSIKDFFSKYDRIRWKLRIWSHLLKKSITENIVLVQRFWLVWFRKMNSNFESQEWRVKRIVLLYCSKEYKISFEKEKYIVAGVENLIEHKLGVDRKNCKIQQKIAYLSKLFNPNKIKPSCHRTIGSQVKTSFSEIQTSVGNCYFFRSTYLTVATFYIQKTSLSDFWYSWWHGM